MSFSFLHPGIFFLRYFLRGEETLVPVQVIDQKDEGGYSGLVPVALMEERDFTEMEIVDGHMLTHKPTGETTEVFPGALYEYTDDPKKPKHVKQTLADELLELVVHAGQAGHAAA